VILIQSGIINVDIEIHKSLVTLLECPKLLVLTSSDPTVDVHNPLTLMLGLPIGLRVQAAFLSPRAAAVRGSFFSQLITLSLSQT
jgi:hypothetical protein